MIPCLPAWRPSVKSLGYCIFVVLVWSLCMNDLLTTDISCPYCGEAIEVMVEVLEESQEYIEDCQVCCRPIVFNVEMAFDGSPSIYVRSENDTY